MIITQDQAVERLSARVYENTRSIRQSNRQRRDIPVDLYGLEYLRLGDANAPARFYISVSPDYTYFERFQFKLIIQPFVSTAGSGTGSATVRVNDQSLSVSSSTITPNPHRHTTEAHTHTVNSGITTTQAAASGYRLSVEGIDITAYLAAQHGAWITGEGVYPALDINKTYDILRVASVMQSEGRTADRAKLLRPGYKPIEISASGPFSATLSLYIKLSHMNR